MSEHKNFVRRAYDAIIEGRSREAQRYLERFERHRSKLTDELTKR